MTIVDKLQYTKTSVESIRQHINNKTGREMIPKGTPIGEWLSLLSSLGIGYDGFRAQLLEYIATMKLSVSDHSVSVPNKLIRISTEIMSLGSETSVGIKVSNTVVPGVIVGISPSAEAVIDNS